MWFSSSFLDSRTVPANQILGINMELEKKMGPFTILDTLLCYHQDFGDISGQAMGRGTAVDLGKLSLIAALIWRSTVYMGAPISPILEEPHR